MKVAGGGTSSGGSERLSLPAEQALIWGVGCSRSCTVESRRRFSAPVNWRSPRPAVGTVLLRRATVARTPASWRNHKALQLAAVRSSAWWVPGLGAGDQSAMAPRRLVYSRDAAKAGRRRGARPPVPQPLLDPVKAIEAIGAGQISAGPSDHGGGGSPFVTLIPAPAPNFARRAQTGAGGFSMDAPRCRGQTRLHAHKAPRMLAAGPEEIEAFAGPVQRVISEAIGQDADSSRT
jgi:hypothetical protein